MPIPPETDWLLQTLNSPVNLFSSLLTFDEMVERCKRNGYEIHEFDCRQFKSQEEIYNAILHSVGELSRDRLYKNIMHIQFWDMFRTPWLKDDCKALMAFRYFDTFFQIDSECGQHLMSLMAGWHYQALQRQTRFIVCAHSEDQNLKLGPVLALPARWVRHESFGADADIEREKAERFKLWLHTMEEELRLGGMTGIKSDEIVRALSSIMKVKRWGDYLDANLTVEDVIRLLDEVEAKKAERGRHDPVCKQRVWNGETVDIFNANSPIERSWHQILEALGYLGQQTGRTKLDMSNATPEEAANLLLSQEAGFWRLFESKNRIVKIEDKDLKD